MPSIRSLFCFYCISIASTKLMLYKKLNELTASRHELMLHIMISRRHSASSMI